MKPESPVSFRFCPWCGAVVSGKETKGRRFRCLACSREVWHNVGASVSAIVEDENGRIAIVVRGKEPSVGKWTLPGGFAEPGEEGDSAARREVFEETGLTTGSLEFVGAWPNRYLYAGIEYPTLDLVYVGRMVGRTEVDSAGEAAALLWVDRADLELRRFAFDSLAAAVEHWLRRRHAGFTFPAERPWNE